MKPNLTRYGTREATTAGGTITVDIPKEWFALPYDDFLGHVVTQAAASHYGFTADDLKQKKGLKEFLEYEK